MHFGGQLDDYVGERIADVLGVGDDHAFAVAQDDVSGDADNGGSGRHIAQHDRACAYAAVVADGDVAQQLGAGADRYFVADGGMALAFFFASSAQGHTLIKSDVVAHDGGLADHRAHAVVDEKAAADLGAGVNLDSSKYARHLRNESCQKTHVVKPQPVAQMMRPDCVQAWIEEEDFEIGASGGVGLEDGGHVFAG